MSLADASITERRRWVFKTATNLYNLQKARFGYINAGQVYEKKIAWLLVKLEQGPEYIRIISQVVTSMNDIGNVHDYLNTLLQAKEDEDFARLLTPLSYPPNSKPSEIIIDPINYLQPVNAVGTKTDESGKVIVDKDQVDHTVHIWKATKKNGKLKTVIEIMGEVGKYALGFGTFAAFNELRQVGSQVLDNRMINSQTVPCVLSGLPLRHVREIEVARSGKILKFRATGSVFLANQEGGEDAIRIEGIFVRSEVIFLLFLWSVFYYGQGRTKEATFDPTKTISQLAIRAKSFDATTWNKETEKPSYEHHYTIPFVTRHIIIPNCYIETLSFEEKIEFGKDIIGYSILLRTYRKPSGFDVYDSESTGLTHISPIGNKNLSMYRVVEFFANMAWRLISANGYFIDEREWKIGGDNAQSDDVYYDVNAEALVSSVVLGLVGLAPI